MMATNAERLSLPQKSTYKHGAVTYEVTAHFCSETESLKSKIDYLLKSDLQKPNTICTFADSHGGDVK
jgi:thiamine biosynthesis protein ThiC